MNKKFSIAVVLLALVLLIAGIFFLDNPENIKNVLVNAKPEYLYIIVMLVVGYWFIQSVVLRQLSLNQGHDLKLAKSYKTQMIGEFFSAITPLATGGQPMQIIYMNRTGMAGGKASSVLAIQLFLYHVSRIILAVVLTFSKFKFFYGSKNAIGILLFIGFITNGFMAAIMVFGAVRPAGLKSLTKSVLKFLHKLKLVKDVEEKSKKLDGELVTFYRSVKRFGGQSFSFYVMLIVEYLIALVLYYSISYYIFLSFGIGLDDIVLVIGAQCAVALVSAYVPLPGGSFGAEGMFYLVFSRIVPEGSPIVLAILIWKLVTYYLTIIVGAPFSMKLK